MKFDPDDNGWAWFDVNHWGTAGPLDGVYWCASNGDRIEGEEGGRFNEVYAWAPADSTGASRFLFGPNSDAWPRGWGLPQTTVPQHYPWVIAVDPRGGFLTGGFGANGLSRVRPRQDGDLVPSQYFPGGYYDARSAWSQGYPGSGYTWRDPLASRSLALKFGWDTHNYLGFADGWELDGTESDAELFQRFEVPWSIRNDPEFGPLVLEYIRNQRRRS